MKTIMFQHKQCVIAYILKYEGLDYFKGIEFIPCSWYSNPVNSIQLFKNNDFENWQDRTKYECYIPIENITYETDTKVSCNKFYLTNRKVTITPWVRNLETKNFNYVGI